ncbi:MAG: ABC transporter ATP-binding protein [Bdellovibrionales bacterium]|nr:ABC transporter ATP-binding protein [Bdellovibrionales bacterium]
MIQVQNIQKNFKQAFRTIEVLKNISFKVDSVKSLAIVGPSGSGKTTLLSLLAGLEKPDSGNIQIADHNITKMNEEELVTFRARHIGIVFQQYHLMPHLTALENVSLPLEIARKKDYLQKAKEQLAKVGMDHRFNHLPSQMSGGECQRVAIARASITHPSVLLADEPSGNLDALSGQKAMDTLFALAKETTLILVTHNMDLANRCDEKMQISNGCIQPF